MAATLFTRLARRGLPSPAVALFLVTGFCAGLLVWAWRPALARVSFQPALLPEEYLDVGIACVAAGEVRPPLDELSDDELTTIGRIIGRLLHAYQGRAFESFLALRGPDLGYALVARTEDVDQLRAFCRELGLADDALPGDWIGLLEAYWEAYYVVAPVASVRPEASVIEVHREGLRGRALESWERSFAELCARHPGGRTDLALTIPHRRPIERVAADSGRMQWLDLQLGFEAYDAAAGWLIVRFVWDGLTEEWFLHRATTVFDGEPRGDRRYLVL